MEASTFGSSHAVRAIRLVLIIKAIETELRDFILSSLLKAVFVKIDENTGRINVFISLSWMQHLEGHQPKRQLQAIDH